MLRNTRSATKMRSGRSAEICLDFLCRDVQIQLDPLQRASREASRILNLWGVDLDPRLTISEQAEAARRRGLVWGVALCALLDQIDPGHCAKQPLIEGQERFSDTRNGKTLGLGLVPRMLGALERLAAQVGLPDPRERIISGYRSPDRQISLQLDWDAGRREGLAVRPVNPSRSRHTQGKAVDIRGTNDQLVRWGKAWQALGYRWGGTFFPKPDPVHFDIT